MVKLLNKYYVHHDHQFLGCITLDQEFETFWISGDPVTKVVPELNMNEA